MGKAKLVKIVVSFYFF